ncbi:hypothetical protein DFH09DRAFT_1087024 [Mycena vulgaris]|nr:hypothetical protein DFH09DRAFT_1087024 [Mycena vulgaris]
MPRALGLSNVQAHTAVFNFVGLGDAINHVGVDGREVLTTAMHPRTCPSPSKPKPHKPAQPISNSAKRGKPFCQARQTSLLRKTTTSMFWFTQIEMVLGSGCVKVENKWIMGKPAIVAGVPDGKSAGDFVSIYAPVVGRGDMYKVFRLATLKTGASSQRGFQAPLRQLPAAGPDPGGFPGFFNIHTFTESMDYGMRTSSRLLPGQLQLGAREAQLRGKCFCVDPAAEKDEFHRRCAASRQCQIIRQSFKVVVHFEIGLEAHPNAALRDAWQHQNL